MLPATIDFSRCNRAHPYWLSTIRNFYLPQPPDAGAPLVVRHIAIAASALKQGSVEKFESTIAALESEGAVGEAFAVSWIHAMHTLVLARGGRFEEARRRSVLSLEWSAAPAEFSHNRGIVEVRLGNIAEAVQAFRTAVEVAPSFGPSWAALALIYALARAHHLAEDAARMARGLDTTVGNDLVGLSLMQATYVLGSLWKARSSFPQKIDGRPRASTTRSADCRASSCRPGRIPAIRARSSSSLAIRATSSSTRCH